MAADAGEGLIDAQSRIQERMDEREEERSRRASHLLAVPDPEQRRRVESLRLAHTELTRQLQTTTHKARRDQLTSALAELDRQLAALSADVSKKFKVKSRK
jgi:DNA-binding TFAR19-related protein (PDSD5 family)